MDPSKSAGKNLLLDQHVRRTSISLELKAESSMSRNIERNLKRKPATVGVTLPRSTVREQKL